MRGYITTPTGGRVTCVRWEGVRWFWSCDACGHGDVGTEQQVRAAGREHLARRALCAFR